MRREVMVSKAWVTRNWKPLEDAMRFHGGFYKYSPKRVMVEICRTECGYSENTLPSDIWAAIERRYKELINEEPTRR